MSIDNLRTDKMRAVMAVSGDNVAIGIPWEENGTFGIDTARLGAGVVNILTIDEQTQISRQTTILGDQNKGLSLFGTSIAMDDRFLVVGAPGEDVNIELNPFYGDGAVYIFTHNFTDQTWQKVAKLSVTELGTAASFGAVVKLSGNYLLVSAPGAYADGDSTHVVGQILLFKYQNKEWQLIQKIRPPVESGVQYFGQKLAFANGLAVVSVKEKETREDELYCYNLDQGKDSLVFQQIVDLDYTDVKSPVFSKYALGIKDSTLTVIHPSDTPRKSVYSFNQNKGWTLTNEQTVDRQFASSRFRNNLVLEKNRSLLGREFISSNTPFLYLERDGQQQPYTSKEWFVPFAVDSKRYLIHDLAFYQDEYLLLIAEPTFKKQENKQANWLQIHRIEKE
ncbi:MAG: FG-GAP repeat protein [Bacteroidota bacterium]